jgi:hypothetical protein
MNTLQKLVVPLAFFLPLVPASASPLLYVVSGPASGAAEFGTLDPSTGSFNQIGPNLAGSSGLVQRSDGLLLTLTFNGNLTAIDPKSGISTLIGPTGLTDCSAPPASPCGPHAANTLASLNGQVYATDFANNLYKVNTSTGATTLVGPTGMPAVPHTPFTTSSDGSFNAFEETLFGANGKLFATFDAITLDPATFTTASVVIAPDLYQIDPATGVATVIGPTDLNLGATAALDGTYYSFNVATSQVVALDLATGQAALVAGFDPGIGLVSGAVATPEPASIAFAGIALVAFAVCRHLTAGVKDQKGQRSGGIAS